MEKFYSQAYAWIDAVHPYQDSSRGSVTADDLHHSAAMLALYAPGRVLDAAYAVTREVSGLVENFSGPQSPEDDLADYNKLSDLLRAYEAEMRRTLKLKKPEDQEAIEG